MRPVVRCIVAWWPRKHDTPFIRPSGIDRWENGKRCVRDATMTLERAAQFASMDYEVIVDPFDMEDLTRFEQQERAKRG